MLPLGFVYIISIIHISDRISLKSSLSRVSISLLFMMLLILPFITAISMQKHRITIGDAGKLNYAWYVSPIADDHYWQGSPETGTPVHSTRIINKEPEIIEFATPVSGSYPVWYDPSYWNDGIHAKFDLKKQIHIINRNLKYLIKLFIAFFLLFFLCVGKHKQGVHYRVFEEYYLQLETFSGSCSWPYRFYLICRSDGNY
jgi:hypothetical protein